MNSKNRRFKPCRENIRRGVLLALLALAYGDHASAAIAQSPLYLGQSSAPLILFNMSRDHKLYYEAYNDASDINNDGVLDIRYNPSITYYGYFDSNKCYSYSSGVFEPVATTTNKQCTGSTSGRWSGDYLNYLTMSRIDALRRVLYGGYRSTDSSTDTILERSYIPQDAHSWGKEYTSTTVDGYDIADYTPLSQPSTNTRHLFANTTLLCPTGNTDPGCSSNTGLPLLRVLVNSSFRVWEWLSIERPVAGVQCATGNNSRSNCAVAGGDVWVKVPASYFSGLTQTTYDIAASSVQYPNSHAEYDTMVTNYAITSKRFGSGAAASIDGTGNPFGTDDFYLTIFQGSLVIPAAEAGSFTFAPTGDDAIEVIIDGTTVAGWYTGHGDGCDDACKTSHSGTITLTAGTHTIEYRHQDWGGGDSYYLWMKRTIPASTMTDYVVRVKACVSGLLETECREYPTDSPTVHKPGGILQEYGENNRMAFGLFTGSYEKNTSGGVLRKNISYLADSNFSSDQEIDTSTGQFTSTNGIIKTLDKLKIVDFGGSYSYNSNCGVPEVNAALAEGRCRMWGNPAAEMMYEGLRYFAGKSAPSSAFSIAASGNDDKDDLNLPLPTWQNPYRTTTGGFPSCSRPSQIVISDINPSYDTDKVPGSFFASYTGDLGTLDVSASATTIWAGEYGSTTPSLFIGQSGNTYDGAPTPKTVSDFKNIRGLSPEEPTKEGGYYEGSVALYGRTHDLNSASGNQKTDTYSIALSSPLPRIELPVGDHLVTLVPFGKTVGGCSGSTGTAFSAAEGSYQATNTIVDFYVDTLKNTAASNTDATVNGGRAYAKFRINYEDSEYGSDHDMDAIVEYELTVQSNGTVDVKLTSGYAAGGCIQHMGYVISGTTADDTYLEVRDSDTGSGSDVDYFLDTPNTNGVALPLVTTRTFTPGSTTSASFVAHDPLWYAAKWGGFIDANNNNQLDTGEWDIKAPTGTPDTYFLVTNASELKRQLDSAFAEITSRNSSASSVATNSTSVGADTLIYQARFNSGDWSGQVRAFHINTNGTIGAVAWDTLAATPQKFPAVGSRKIYSYNPAATGAKGIAFCWDAANCFTGATAYLSAAQKTTLTSADIVNYLRGDQSNETTQSGGTYRARATLLGDIVNSDPWYVGTQSFGYESLPGSEGSRYISFRNSTPSATPPSTATGIRGRRTMIYVGANDGMLHAFDATSGTDGGTERFAYVPSSVINSGLVTLSGQGYTGANHKYFVDGSPKAGDVYYSGAWRTVLVGTTGAGGKGVFALDVTYPDSFDQSKVLWEFTDSNDTDLGFTMSQASIVRMANGKFAAVFGNGYESSSGKAALFILDIADGSLIKKIVADTASGNGLSTPIAVDIDNDRIVDYIYAGDLKGNLWKFDVSDSSDTNWAVAYSGSPLYVAADKTTPTAVRQPITVKPQVGRASASGQAGEGVMVYFGTGKYFEVGDNILPTSPSTPQVQSFYGIWDKCDKSPPSPLSAATCDAHFTGRTDLVAQTIDAEGIPCLVDVTASPPVCSANYTSTAVRVTSNNSVGYAFDSPGKRGWFMDLQQPPTPTAQGERVFSNPLLRGNKIIFTTLVPGDDPCDYGGDSWLMELSATTGQRFSNAVFDTNNNGAVNSADNVFISSYSTEAVSASGVQSTVDIIKTPTVVNGKDSGGGCTEFKVVSGSSGELASTQESCSEPSGRMSWRQLR